MRRRRAPSPRAAYSAVPPPRSAAARASQETGCPCRFLGPLEEAPAVESGAAAVAAKPISILMETKLQFEWEHVATAAGGPHVVSITYHDLKVHGRPVPRCPLRLRHLLIITLIRHISPPPAAAAAAGAA